MSARMDFARFLHDSQHYDNGLPICRPWMLCTAQPFVGSPTSSTAKTVSRDARNWCSALSASHPYHKLFLQLGLPKALGLIPSSSGVGSITCVKRSVPLPGITSFASWLKWLPSCSRAESRRRFDPAFAEPPSWPSSQNPMDPFVRSAARCFAATATFHSMDTNACNLSSPRWRAHASCVRSRCAHHAPTGMEGTPATRNGNLFLVDVANGFNCVDCAKVLSEVRADFTFFVVTSRH